MWSTVAAYATKRCCCCCCCCCCYYKPFRSPLSTVPSNVHTGPTDADVF
ncbi:unnamed protein product, partial [Ectocarpus fasciculatus]